jgi:hypothetical protein
MRFALPILFVAFALVMPAQVFDPTGSSNIAQYLELTTQQRGAVSRLAAANAQFQLQKQERIAVVNREIEAELRKSPLDPMAIGLRYVELATIQREIGQVDRQFRTDLRALLTDAQKEKLKPLEEALRLQSLANQAVCQGFIEPLPVVRIGCTPFAGNIIPVGSN